ncbi:MAG: hypothetical protein ACM3NO_11345 [Deltaproteobacteria bacterium]
MTQTVLGLAELGSRDARRSINNDLQTIDQVLYMLNLELSSDQTRLRSFVGVGQSALRRVADTFASFGEGA